MTDRPSRTASTINRLDRPGVARRDLLQMTGAGIAALGLISATRAVSAQQGGAWDKTFPQSGQVSVERVSFTNGFGITLVGDLYVPKAIDRSRSHPALIVGHPFGSIKEQTSGLYAQTLAERGFVTLAFDASYGGESGGTPRLIGAPEAFVEDFSAAVDFLGVHPLVDRARIGSIGICASGAFVISAAQSDRRIRAIATVSLWDLGRESREGIPASLTYEQRTSTLDDIGNQRWVEAAGGQRFMIGVPETVDAQTPQLTREFHDYYRTPRAQHPRATTEFALSSVGRLVNFFPTLQIQTISPRPILIIAGENALSRYLSEDAFKRAAQPKTLHLVPGAGHVDLYDRVNLIPFDTIGSFFTEHLA